MQVDRMASSSNGLSEAEIQMNLKALKKVAFLLLVLHVKTNLYVVTKYPRVVCFKCFKYIVPSLTRASRQLWHTAARCSFANQMYIS